jgi:hypothetical protein
VVNDAGRRTPYVFQWLFNIQRQLTENTALELGYQGNAGHKLERLTQENQAVQRSGPNDASSAVQRRPWGAVYDRIQQLAGNVDSNYNAFNARLQQRLTKGLTYMTGFTWSKALDTGSGIRNSGNDADYIPVDAYNPSKEYGPSHFDNRRRFVSSIMYELPIGKGKRFAGNVGSALNLVIGGWQVGSILTLADGFPVSIGFIGDTNGIANGMGNVPEATGISPIPTNRSASNFWNIAAFNATDPRLYYQSGTAGRDCLVSPGTKEWDFSTIKNMKIREGQSLEFRFEAFNLPNHPNWNVPAVTVTSPSTFGKVTSAGIMRELQLGLKYSF